MENPRPGHRFLSLDAVVSAFSVSAWWTKLQSQRVIFEVQSDGCWSSHRGFGARFLRATNGENEIDQNDRTRSHKTGCRTWRIGAQNIHSLDGTNDGTKDHSIGTAGSSSFLQSLQSFFALTRLT